jgi:hypothetical protein
MMGFAWGIGGIFALFVGIFADWLGLYTTFIFVALLALPGYLLARRCPNQSKDINNLL